MAARHRPGADLRRGLPRDRLAALRPQGHHELNAPRVVHVGADRLAAGSTVSPTATDRSTPAVTADAVTLTAADGVDRGDRGAVPAAGRVAADRPARARRAASGASACCWCVAGASPPACSPGATLESSKVDSSYVQGTTKAGGWSQQRYARRRANQATRGVRRARPTRRRASSATPSSTRSCSAATGRRCAACSPTAPGAARAASPGRGCR